VSSDSGYGYYDDEEIKTSYGYYDIYEDAGSTSETAGTVHTTEYYDVTSNTTYAPYDYALGKADGSGGLGTEYDYTYGANGYQTYGDGGVYEAKQGGGASLYDFYFVYSDGGYYYGTVASSSSTYGYYLGETISTSYGYYYIYKDTGSTSEKAGTVYTDPYYDVTSNTTYTPYYYALGEADGYSGLGSEFDYTDGTSGYQSYGDGGEYEAKQYNTLYDFYFEYSDGSYYYGTVAATSANGYYVGLEIQSSSHEVTYGYYYIYADLGSTSEKAGTVYTDGYYDVTSGKSYDPYFNSLGEADGSHGLGSESDYTYGANGYRLFGYGVYEAKQGTGTALYDFYFEYSDGSYYEGTVASNSSTYGYYLGEEIKTNYGYYYIYADTISTSEQAGTVYTTDYFDITSSKSYTPYYYALGEADGSSGLGAEFDYTDGASGYQYFGDGGEYEAKQGGTQLYDFYFVYSDGSYYYGTVASSSSTYGYYSGETIQTSYGYYYIYENGGSTGEKAGTVYTTDYYDVGSGKSYTPYYYSLGDADGSGGLGSEFDYTYGAGGYQAFGDGGKTESIGPANSLYDFYFVYSDGSYYYGTVSSNSSYGYYSGEEIKTSYGYYYIYDNAGSTTEKAGTVYTTDYYDVTSSKSYTPYYDAYSEADGISGLGSESDYTYGPQGYLAYGEGGEYEAKQGDNGLYNFYFEYSDGSYYYGTVSSNDSYNYYVGVEIKTSYGYYYIYGSAGSTTEKAGTVTTDDYYDASSGKAYTPYFYSLGEADGTSGLGSEYDYTDGANGYQLYGIGGKYEAKQ
jgi:hypothetical protein